MHKQYLNKSQNEYFETRSTNLQLGKGASVLYPSDSNQFFGNMLKDKNLEQIKPPNFGGSGENGGSSFLNNMNEISAIIQNSTVPGSSSNHTHIDSIIKKLQHNPGMQNQQRHRPAHNKSHTIMEQSNNPFSHLMNEQ